MFAVVVMPSASGRDDGEADVGRAGAGGVGAGWENWVGCDSCAVPGNCCCPTAADGGCAKDCAC